MIRHSRLVGGACSAALAVGLLGPAVSTASAHSTGSLLGSVSGAVSTTLAPVTSAVSSTATKVASGVSSVSAASAASTKTSAVARPHLTPASEVAIARDLVAFSASGGGQKGLGPLLSSLSQVKGISGTQFGEDLGTLASESSGESGVSWQNCVAGAEKLQAESGEFPAPFNTFFYNLGGGLVKLYDSSL